MPTALFPSQIATDEQLKVAANLIETKLRVAINDTDTVLFVASTAGFAPNMLVSIDREIIAIAGVAPAPDSTLTVATGGRGFDGTAAASHAANVKVSLLIDAWHHNALASEVKAIETALGPNLSNIPGGGIISSSYNFAAQSPGGNLIVGNNVITMTPVPVGVNGTDQNHYLYISGGTGTAEAALITGGSAVSGAPSGTLIVNCANTHSGAWTIRSATAGIQEAAQSQGMTNVQIRIPAGTHDLFAPITITGDSVVLQGAGIGPTALVVSPGTYDAVTFQGPASWCSIRDLTINSAIGRAGGFGVTARSQIQFDIMSVRTGYMPNGFHITSGNQNSLWNIYVFSHTGAGILVDGPNGYALLVDQAIIASAPSGAPAGIQIRDSGDCIVNNSALLLNQFGLLADPGNGQTIASLELNSVYCDNNITAGLAFLPATGGYIVRSRMNSVWAASTSAGPGMSFSTLAGGTIEGVQIVNAQVYLNKRQGLVAGGLSNLSITASHFCANGLDAPGSYPGAVINTSNFQFIGNVSGMGDGSPDNSQSHGLQIFPGPNNNYIVANNDFRNNVLGALDDGGTGLNKVVKDNLGVDDAPWATIASAAAISLATSGASSFYISGTTTITTINGGWNGRRITLIKYDAGSVTIGGGGNVPVAHPLAQYQSLHLVSVGSFWY